MSDIGDAMREMREKVARLEAALVECGRVRDAWCEEYVKMRDAFYAVIASGRLTLVSGSGDEA